MAGCPDAAVDSGGAVPLTPVSRRTSGSPRHTGGDGDGVAVRVAVGLLVRVTLGMRVRVPLPDGLLDGLRRLATLIPRYVRRVNRSAGDSLLPPLPPPAAASHSSTDSRSPLTMRLLGTSCVTLTNRKHSDAAESCRALLASNE